MTCAESAFPRHSVYSTTWRGRPDTQSHVRLHLPTQDDSVEKWPMESLCATGTGWRKAGANGPTYISSCAMAGRRLILSFLCTLGSTV